jgi:class 3 adenylate cyclase
MVQQLWSRYLNTGVGNHLIETEIRYIRASNGIVVIVGLLLLLQVPALIWLLPNTKYLLASFLFFPLLWMLVPVMNYHKQHTAGRLFFSLSCILLISISAIQIGKESDNHFFMIAVFLGAFIIYPPRQLSYILSITVLSGLAMVMLEIYFINNTSVLTAPPAFFKVGRFLSVTALFLIIFFISAHHYSIVATAEAKLATEYEVSEKLLLNILPPSIAQRLKKQPGIIADQFESATVLFADLCGFTSLSASMKAEEVVSMLNLVFSRFDHICDTYKLEKIKTIGDSYMLTGGVPDGNLDHCEAVANCALDMLHFMHTNCIIGKEKLSLRIGIHTGPVIAGIIGEQKFSYDLWGDTVNIASRMESHGSENRIQVSRQVYETLRDKFYFNYRGKIEVKGMGEMDVYFLEGRLNEKQFSISGTLEQDIKIS